MQWEEHKYSWYSEIIGGGVVYLMEIFENQFLYQLFWNMILLKIFVEGPMFLVNGKFCFEVRKQYRLLWRSDASRQVYQSVHIVQSHFF